MEEIDLCWRLHRLGKKIMYSPRSTVYHLGGGTLAQGHPRKTYLNFRNGLYLLIKNAPLGRLAWTLPLRLAMDAVAAWRFLMKGYPKDFWAVAKAHLAVLTHIRQLWRKRGGGKPDFSLTDKDTCYPGSIVWSYFVRKKKKFQDLGWH
jgi:GT2 family glycosyltransferase